MQDIQSRVLRCHGPLHLRLTAAVALGLIAFASMARAQAEGAATLGSALAYIRTLPGRDYKVCVEGLDHLGNHGQFLMTEVLFQSGYHDFTKRTELIRWLEDKRIHNMTYRSVILLMDDELLKIEDNPMDVIVPAKEIEGTVDEILAQCANLSGVGILSGHAVGLLSSRKTRLELSPMYKLRNALLLLSDKAGIEWDIEITPNSRALKKVPPGAHLMGAPNGFLTCRLQ